MPESTNPYAQLRRQLAGPSLQLATVISGSSGAWTVQLVGGGQLRARGNASIGQQVWLRGDLIEGQAPGLPVVTITV